MSEEPNQVITEKNEGRVAAGKRLAEWNRKDKLEKKKNLGKSTSQESQEPAAGPSKSTGSVYIYGAGGLVAVLACVGGVYYILRKLPMPMQQQQPTKTSEPLPDGSTGVHTAPKPTRKPDIDIFNMKETL